VVFTGDWVPDHELARRGGLIIDRGTKAPRTDGWGRTSMVGVFAAGNLLHGAETADRCALEGRPLGASVTAWVTSRGTSATAGWPAAPVPIVCRSPLAWITPNAVAPDEGRGVNARFALGSDVDARAATLEVRQAERVLHRRRAVRLIPNRPAHL